MDDLHNADQPALELLRLASHALHDTRVMVAAAFRTCGMAQRCWTGALVESRNWSARRVELAGLEPAATAQLFNQVVGERWAGSVIRRIHNLTGGNPGLVLETAYSCLEQAGSNGLNALGVKVPGAVRTAVEERLAPLSPDARRLLGLASVIGESFETQTVAELGQIGSELALRALAEVEGAGLIGSVSERGYRFANGFVRRVLYEQFPARPRAALHKQLASALEAAAATTTRPTAQRSRLTC
jgi:predicted ATPase